MIYVVVRPESWVLAERRGYFYENSIASEGFIHAATWRQLERVANHYFPGAAQLMVLGVDLTRLKPPVRWELSRSTGDVYPHIYGIVNLDAATVVITLSRSRAGRYELPAIEPVLQANAL